MAGIITLVAIILGLYLLFGEFSRGGVGLNEKVVMGSIACIGICLTIYFALFYDISIKNVVNAHKMQNRNIGVLIGLAMILIPTIRISLKK